MRIAVPSIDLIGGKAVRLRQGREGTEEFFGDPIMLSKRYLEAGFEWLHIVDLDAAFGRESQIALIAEVADACPGIRIQWAGGMRSLGAASAALSGGASRIVFGTAVASSPDIVQKCSNDFGSDRVWASLDFAGSPPKLMVKGWKESVSLGLEKAVKNAERCDVGGLIIGSVDNDGMGLGPDLALTSSARKLTGLPLWIAGGIRDSIDARKAFLAGADGAILGRALYDSRIGMEEWTCLGKI